MVYVGFMIAGIALYWVGFFFDSSSSEKVASVGGKEWNPLSRDKDGKFSPAKNLIWTIGFFTAVLISHFTWLPDDQKGYTGPALLLIGAVRLVVAFAVNYPLYRKLKKI